MEFQPLSCSGRTLSMQLIADPIAKQIGELEKLVYSKRGGSGFPDVVSASTAIREAVCKLHQIATTELSNSQDKQLKVDMPMACDLTLKASEKLVDAARRLRQQPNSRHAKSLFLEASQGIQSGVIQVLLHWDNAQVCKICDAAQVARDRLQIMSGSKSMRGLLLCFKGYAESMKELLVLVDKRQKELVNKERKQRLLQSLDKMKLALPKFSSAMQNHVRAHNPTTKEAKNVICADILRALDELVASVKEDGTGARSSMARTIETVKGKLGTSKRYSIGPELDRHIDAIMENSKAVAHVSRDEYREVILRGCGEVLTLRKELGTHFEAVSADPGSARAKRAFDKCTKKLCEKLNELDRWVADSVVDQVTDVFVEASAPLNHLVQAATGTDTPQRVHPTPPTAPPPSFARHTPSSTGPRRDEVDTGPSPATEDTKKMAELFRRHSRRLSQVAAYAAQSSTDAERIKLIKDLADAIDELTYVVVERAENVSKNPADRKAREELNALRRKWASKVQELTRVIDDIIDPEDFMAQSEANIQQDMEKCQAAMQSGRWEELRRLVLAIAAKARRALEVGETAVTKASDHTYKTTLSSAVTRLERAIPKIISTANRLIEEPANRERRDHFLNSLQELLNSLHNIQSVLGTEIDITSEEEELSSSPSPRHRGPNPPRTSVSPLRTYASPHKHRTTAEERMTKRNVQRAQTKPQYIGSLGASKGRLLKNTQQQSDEADVSFGSDVFSQSFDSSTQTTPPPKRNQSSQIDDHYLSTNATYGSASLNPRTLSPNSSTSTWKTPLTPVSMSPVRHAPPSPDEHTPLSPPGYPAPSPPSHSPPLSPRRPAPSSPTINSYVSPFQKLVSAAQKGDQQEVKGHSANLSARVIRLTGMADSAASTLNKDSDLVKVIKTKSSEVAKLTPRILDQATLLSRNPQGRQPREEFQAVTHQWAGNVRDLINAMQQANLPWSRRAEQLVDAAENKDGLDLQMDHISTQTRKMVDVATMAIEAARTEEAIGGTGDPDTSVDRELQEEVRLVRTKMSEIEKLTPQLLGAAEMAAGQPADSAASEHLHLLAQEWATKAKMLMKGVDDITLGMGGAADTLFLSAKSGDPGLQMQQTKAIKHFASSLQAIADEALEGCDNEEKMQVVRVVARKIEKLSTRMVECADTVAGAMEEEEELDQTVQEDTEILRRDWSSQVHLLTAHIDDLTAEASAPLDRLVDISLQANRTSSLQTKQLLMKRFEAKATFLSEQLNLVEKLFGGVAGSLVKPERAVRDSGAAISFLKKLSPHAVAAAKSLESEAGSAMLEHFNHLRRQWAAKAQFLLGSLRKTVTVNVDEVIDAFMDLLHDSHVTSPRPNMSDLSDNLSISSQSSSTLTPMQRSYSSEVIGDTTPVTRFDFDDSDFKAPSTPMIDSRPKKKKQHIPTLSEMGLRPVPPRVKRPTSMAVPLPSWAAVGDTTEESSADSIALAAQSLRELTDQFLEESNPMVQVGKTMSEQMSQMAEFARGKGELKDKTDMILTAKAVAANGQTIHRIANVISKQCEDVRSRNNLLCCAEMIPTLSTQLTILASVKTATPDDSSADVMLVKNAQNLMQAVIKTVQAAEAACMKEPKPVLTESMAEGEDQEAVELAMSWKRKLYFQRAKESISAPRGARGLRKLNKYRISTPSVVDVIKPSEEHMKSPTKH